MPLNAGHFITKTSQEGTSRRYMITWLVDWSALYRICHVCHRWKAFLNAHVGWRRTIISGSIQGRPCLLGDLEHTNNAVSNPYHNRTASFPGGKNRTASTMDPTLNWIPVVRCRGVKQDFLHKMCCYFFVWYVVGV
jgi:hypothetical protein